MPDQLRERHTGSMSAPVPGDLWDQVKERVRSHVNEQSFATWFSPTAQERFSEGLLVVSVPSKFFRDWLNEHFQVLIRETASAIAGRECTVVFQPLERKAEAERPRQDDLPFTRTIHHGGTVLNSKYTGRDEVVSWRHRCMASWRG